MKIQLQKVYYVENGVVTEESTPTSDVLLVMKVKTRRRKNDCHVGYNVNTKETHSLVMPSWPTDEKFVCKLKEKIHFEPQTLAIFHQVFDSFVNGIESSESKNLPELVVARHSITHAPNLMGTNL